RANALSGEGKQVAAREHVHAISIHVQEFVAVKEHARERREAMMPHEVADDFAFLATRTALIHGAKELFDLAINVLLLLLVFVATVGDALGERVAHSQDERIVEQRKRL